jgi:hypothetical protein
MKSTQYIIGCQRSNGTYKYLATRAIGPMARTTTRMDWATTFSADDAVTLVTYLNASTSYTWFRTKA